MSLLAKRTQRDDSSGIRKIFALAHSMKDPINLSIGQPDFEVPDLIKSAAIDAIQQGHNSYTPTNGIVPLREQLIAEEGIPISSVLFVLVFDYKELQI